MGISLLPQFFFICTLSIFYILNFPHFIYSQCLDDKKNLLLELKAELVFNSFVSTKLVRWNQTKNCCSWVGVECDVAGHVIGLQLDGEMISSGIDNSSTLFSLKYLENLNLAFNDISLVQIPRRIHNLVHLTQLNLSNTGFGGQVPVELSLMRKLVSLDLSFNLDLKLENLNLRMLLQNLTRLRELYLDNVDISSEGTEWCEIVSSSLPDLRKLSLRLCNISGPLDHSLSQLHSLSVLQLDGNNLSTPVPNFFANFSSLTTLTLASCFLKGHFPEMIFQIPTLETLDVSDNMLLSGSIPQFNRIGSFRTLVLTSTNFSGLLPDSISNLTMLSYMDLSNCNFTGPIPSTLVNLKELSHIDLSNNNLTGFLSSMYFDGSSNLSYVNLGNNLIGGEIPESFFRLPLLKELILSNNIFSGQVNEISTLCSSNIEVLDLSSNQLEGPIPESFFKLESLFVLSLSYNFFNGTIELEKFQRLSNLATLQLSYNNLSLTTSSNDSNLPSLPHLVRLELASCNLHKFPNLTKQSECSYLDLSNNRITGEIPNWIWEIGNGLLDYLNLSSNLLKGLQKPYNFSNSISLLDLHSNQLKGEFPLPPPSVLYVDYSNNHFENSIPHEIGSFISLALFLSLANNNLNGAIPISFCNAISLQVLDLSNNNLSGGIPPCLVENMSVLMVLNLGRNSIGGDIPDAFRVNCFLKTLDLCDNDLGGKIPLSLANCKSLEVLNVGNNNINDSFPCMLSASLRVLILRTNRFHGEVRCHESWSYLQIIDIASNNFSGYLHTESFLSWGGMMRDNDAQLRPNDLRVVFLVLDDIYYQDKVGVTFKGLEMELVKILMVFKSIDFSCNNFKGEIPAAIGDLSSLYVLNLSHNILTGKIPKTIGNLRQLGSLDLSMNQLTWEIPKDLARLTFLQVLNLSYNKLVGMIPNGPQFQTFSPDSFEGNMGLCGFPLNKSCNNMEGNGAPIQEPKSEPLYIKDETEWGFVSAALGFVVGLGSSLWLLWGYQSVRQKFSDWLEDILAKILNQKKRYGRRVPRNRVIRRG